jgi:hypothetical protein
MPKMYHPTLDDVSYEVAEGDVEKWTAQGWLKSKPKKKS